VKRVKKVEGVEGVEEVKEVKGLKGERVKRLTGDPSRLTLRHFILELILIVFALVQSTAAQSTAAQTSFVYEAVAQTSSAYETAAQTSSLYETAAQTFSVYENAAQTPDGLRAMLPPIEGWSVIDDVEVYDSENLYDKIDGAAPGFILFNFQELTVLEYNKNGAGDDLPPYISIQVYRHDTPTDAFGVYASERPSETNFVTTGTEGYQEGAMLNFFVDNLYVKIESPHTDDETVKIVRQIAQEFGRKINEAPVFPEQLLYFPPENKIAHSEIYIPSGFLGHEFLTNAFTAKYTVSGKKYQLFIIDAESAEQANAMLTKYIQFTKQDLKLQEGRLTIKDRFNGDLECQWKGRYIWGIINDSNAPVNVEEVLKEAGERF